MALGLTSRYPQIQIERDKLLRDVQLDSYEIEAAVKSFEELVIEIEQREHYQEHQRVLDYLKSKYDGFNGVPVCNLEDELMCDTDEQYKAVKQQITHEMKKKTLNRDDFVPFEIVADALLAIKELR